ncbi:MAG TPA: hypothetical protein DD490_13080 [Acidobacteria bacterium]|nr:hypothetical protein [Acidobacteriota bacterium]
MTTRQTLLLILLLPLLGAPAAAQPFGRPLTLAQVECEERQLERLQHRMMASPRRGSVFLWRAAAAGGAYRGLVSTNDLGRGGQGRAREESQLAFDLLFKPAENFLDPRRQPLPQATFVRRDGESNLNSTRDPWIWARIDLAAVVEDPTRPTQPLTITNQRNDGYAHDDGAARGFAADDFFSACHGDVSDFDLRIFPILARTVRPSPCLLEPLPHCGGTRFRVVFFRGTEPLTYRMNIYEYLVSCYDDGHCEYGEARTAFVLKIQVDDRGRLTGGDIQVLPLCTDASTQVGCSTSGSPNYAVYVLPPLRPGIDHQGEAEFERAGHLNLEHEGSPYTVGYDTVNWADLLRDTAWNGGLVP